MDRSYEKTFLQRGAGHSRASDKTADDIVAPLNESENTARLYSGQVKFDKSSSPSMATGRAISSSRIINHSEWKKIAKENRARSPDVKQTKKLSAVMRQAPISLENGRLSLVGCYLTEIDLLPSKVSSLVQILYLSNNSLTSLVNIQQFRCLTCLSLANNSLRYLHSLAPLSNLLSLEKLSLEGNVVTHMPYYREVVLGLCYNSRADGLSLKSLDSSPVSPEEKRNCRVNFRKCCLQIEQLRSDGLRVAVLEHMHLLFACHAEIIGCVMGKFRSLLGPHIEINSSHHFSLGQTDSSSCVASTLRYTLAGGVFRWVQISGGRDFEKQAQDLAYRLFLTSLRSITSSQKSSVFDQPSHLTAHWDSIMSDCSHHFQRIFLLLIEKCELSYEKILLAAANKDRFPSQLRDRGDSGVRKISSDSRETSILSMGAHVVSSLQALQFIGCEVFQDSLTHAMNQTIPTKFEPSSETIQFELQQTYCGLGLHYHTQSRGSEKRKASEMPRMALPLDEKRNLKSNITLRAEDNEAILETDARQRYIKLLKDGIYKKGGSKLNKEERKIAKTQMGETKPRDVLESQRILVDSVNVVTLDSRSNPVEIFEDNPVDRVATLQGEKVLGRLTTSDDTVLTVEASLPSLSDFSSENHENIPTSLLLSSFANLLASPSFKNHDETFTFSPLPSEWTAQCFQSANLPLPDMIRDALLQSSISPSGAPPVDIIGSPPLPIAPLPTLSNATMKSLTQLFDELQREAENISSRSNTLLCQRRNLVIGSEKMRGHLASDCRVASSKLDQYVLSIRKVEEEMQQFVDLIPLVEQAKEKKVSQLSKNTELSTEIKNLEARFLDALESAKTEFQRKEDIASTTEEVIAAVSAMNEEIHNSREIQQSLHSQHLSQLLHGHLLEPNRLLSLQRSVFSLFRSRVAHQKRLKKLSTRNQVKKKIHLLLLCWHKFEKYVISQRRERKIVDWVVKLRTAMWFRSWKVALSRSQRTREHQLRYQRRHLSKAVNVWRSYLSHQEAYARVEGDRGVKMRKIALRWMFRSWKTQTVRKLSSYNLIKGETTCGEKVLPPLTVALRCREVIEHRNSSLAHLQYQRSHFNGWRKVIFLNRRILADHEAVLMSIQTHRSLKETFREWRSIYLSFVCKKNRAIDRSWQRWVRFNSVRISSRRLGRRGAEMFHVRKMFRTILHWLEYKQKRCKLRNALGRCREYLMLKAKIKALVGWKVSYSMICEKRQKEGCAMTFYLKNLRKRSWIRWIQCYQFEKNSKARKREWVQSERNLFELQVREEALNRRVQKSFVTNDSEMSVGGSSSDSEEDSSLVLIRDASPHSVVTQKKMWHSFMSWLVYARESSRLRVAQCLCSLKSRKKSLGLTFSYLLSKWAQKCHARIMEGKSLVKGSESFQQRSIVAREEIASLQDQIDRSQESVDDHRAILAEKQEQLESLSEMQRSLDSEIGSIRRNLDSVTISEREQRELIDSLLFLCMGESSTRSHVTSSRELDEGEFSLFLSEKMNLLSKLEKCNENALATNRYREQEKHRLHLGIREGLQIGHKYKDILLGLSQESKSLEEERLAGETCLQECGQNLEHTLKRVEEKATSDQQQLFDLNLEKTKLANRLHQAIEEETALREELIRLRADFTLSEKIYQVVTQIQRSCHDWPQEKQCLTLLSPFTLAAARNTNTCSMNTALSRSSLSVAHSASATSLKSFLEDVHKDPKIPLPEAFQAQVQIVNQMQLMNRDDNRRLYQTLSLPLSPPTVTSISSIESVQSSSPESIQQDSGISGRIRNISQRIRERLETPPQI